MTDTRGIHQGYCGEWSGVDLLLLERQDRNPLKAALTAAILVHLVVFWWNIWPAGKPLPLPPVKKPPILYDVRLPERPPEKKPLQPDHAMKVPVPDTTPFEVEPMLEAVPLLDPPLPSPDAAMGDLDYHPAVQGPPLDAAPIRDFEATAAPVVLHRVEPEYPPLARAAGVEGRVILEAVIGRDGRAGQITVLSAPSGKFGFDRAAVLALRQWAFKPGEMHGRKVDVIMTLTVKFKLRR